MKNWKCNCGIEICEVEFDHDLHAFEAYNGDKYLGAIYPANAEDMQYCIDGLDDGECPICDGWEDGNGNKCANDGWGQE